MIFPADDDSIQHEAFVEDHRLQPVFSETGLRDYTGSGGTIFFARKTHSASPTPSDFLLD